MKKIFLLCNAHLDPVWLWQRAEGMAEAVATFRIAADFCESYDGFVFNHNEAVLYEWVKENEPELFERIRQLVKCGKWRIMGGWYLQPDVVMPCGESVIRQIRVGNDFFEKYFGEIPKTSIGFDAFGHSKGLVQILKKCGYENYAYLRPRDTECGPFIWQGFDGSCINTYKLYEWYNTPKGEALDRIKSYIKDFPERNVNLITWGIGNHGGGPSRKDWEDIQEFVNKTDDVEFIHSGFDEYFDAIDKSGLRVEDKSLTHCMVGCYTSMVRIKQGHRRLENLLGVCEQMLCQSGAEYSTKQLAEAEKALLFSEFHDVLPGSAIKKVEEDSLRLIGYGEEILDRLMSRAFFRLCRGQKKAAEGEIPVMVYNPLPYKVEGDFEVEFQLAEQNHPDNGIYNVRVRDEYGNYIPCQLEQEDSTHGMDWRKKVVFHAKAAPMSISRFDCELTLERQFEKIKPFAETDTHFVFDNEHLSVTVSKETGLVDKYLFHGKNVIDSLKIKAYRDNADPWGMEVDGFSDYIGEFKAVKPARVIENGDVRTKIQSVLEYGKSQAVVTYVFQKQSKSFDIEVKILSNDINIMFKLCAETALEKSAAASVQTMFGTEAARKGGKEAVMQKWCGLNDGKSSVGIINNGTYGVSFEDGEIRLSLLRTPVYSAHPVDGVTLAPDTREYERIDIGERDFKFRICTDEEFMDYEAEKFNKKAFVLSFFPSGDGEKKNSGLSIDNKNIILSALRREENAVMMRLYNSSGNAQSCSAEYEGRQLRVEFTPFEVKTFVINKEDIKETNMLGR